MSPLALSHYVHSATPLRQRPNLQVLRGIRRSDGARVVLKVADVGSAEAARLAHEMKILTAVWSPERLCVPRPLELLAVDAGLALVTQDEGGMSLDQSQLSAGDTQTLLQVSEATARALASLHACRVVHKNINPSNVIWCAETRQVQLIDLGHASELAYEKLQSASLEGTPAYMSPEQTGRTQQALDYRTDLYSLGATLYALFGGRPPFLQRDLGTLLYSILAEVPTPLNQVNAQVPPAVEAIVARLMAKNPAERYQSAHGAAEDLVRCLERLSCGLPLEGMELGRDDPVVRLELPRRIDGRDAEVEQLLKAFHRVSHSGQPHLVLLSGPPGIGKSSLLQALQPALLQQHGFYLSGKHEELQRHLPLASLRQAFTDLVAQLLREPEGMLQVWSRRLRVALSTIGQAVIDIMPDLELIVGKQRALPPLGPREAENRLLTAVQSLMRAVCSKQPVVLFLDDVQWSDSSTLRVLRDLVEPSQQGNPLLVVCAFRSGDADAGHPLWDAVRAIDAAGQRVSRIEVGPLTLSAFEGMLCEVLRSPPERVQSLAAWLHTKSGGNVFFLRELLAYFWEHQHITYRADLHAFAWDMAVLERTAVPDGVVGLLASNIAALRPEEASLLRLAACMGDACTLAALTQVSGLSAVEVQALLERALTMGLLLPLSSSNEATPSGGLTYQFPHDRVRQAAYEGLDRDTAERTHLRYGAWLWQRLDAGESSLFAVLQQMNAGAQRIVDPAQRRSLAELNLRGAIEGHQSGAHATALNCLRVALELLPSDLAVADFNLFARIQAELADNEYVSGKFDDALARLDGLVARGGFTDRRALARLHESRGRVFVARAQFQEAIKAAMAGMSSLGYQVDLYSQGVLVRSMVELVVRLRLSRFETLVQAPACTDPYVALTMALLSLVAESAYHTSPATLMAVAVNICLLTIKHGVTVNSAFSYGAASTFFALISQYPLALRLSGLAQALSDRPGVTNQAGVTFTCGAWTNHLSVSPLEMTARHALQPVDA